MTLTPLNGSVLISKMKFISLFFFSYKMSSFYSLPNRKCICTVRSLTYGYDLYY